MSYTNKFDEFWDISRDFPSPFGDDLYMCRYNNDGAFEIGNIYKATEHEIRTEGPRSLPE